MGKHFEKVMKLVFENPDLIAQKPGTHVDITRSTAKAGRPTVPLADKIAVFLDPEASEGKKTEARLVQLFGHLLTLRGVKYIHAGSTEPIGIGMDGVTVDGRKIMQVRCRSNHFKDPFIQYGNGVFLTITLPPLMLKRVTNKAVQGVVQKTKRLKWDEHFKQNFNEGCSMSVLLDHLSELISTSPLVKQRPLLLTIDKGPEERHFFLWLQCTGELIYVFFDGPHIENMAVKKVAEKHLPAQMKRVSGVRKTADGVHSVKLADSLRGCAKLDDQDLIDQIGTNAANLCVELSCHPSDVCGAFRTAALEAIPHLASFDQERWLTWAYECRALAKYWTTYQIASELNYVLEGGEPDELLMARVESLLIAPGVRRCNYNKDDVDNLVSLIVHGAAKGDGSDDATLAEADNKPSEEENHGASGQKRDAAAGVEGNETEAAGQPTSAAAAREVFLDSELKPKRKGAVTEQEKMRNSQKTAARSKRIENAMKNTRPDDLSIFLSTDDMDNTIALLYHFFANDWNRFQILIYERCSRPVLFGHGLMISITHLNFNTKMLSYLIQVMIMAETARILHEPLTSSLAHIAHENDHFARRFGTCIVDQIFAQLKIHCSDMVLRMRLWMLAKVADYELNFSGAMRLKDSEKQPKKVRWVLENARHFTSDPGVYGLTADSTRMRNPYTTDVCLAVSSWLGSELDGTDSKITKSMLHFGVGDSFRQDLMESEPRVWEAKRCVYTADGFGPAELIKPYLLFEPEYKITGDLIDELKHKRGHAFCEKLRKCAQVQVRSTRDIEVAGAAMQKGSVSAHAAGSLTDQLPLHLAERLAPEWVRWFDKHSYWENKHAEGEDAGPMPKLLKPKGIKNSWSQLDGRQPLYGLTSDEYCEAFWNDATTLEEAVPFVSPAKMDDWWCTNLEKLHAEQPCDEELVGFYDSARLNMKADLVNHPYPNNTQMRKDCRDGVDMGERKIKLSPEEMDNLKSFHFNVDNMWKAVIAEGICVAHQHDIAFKRESFDLNMKRGRLHCLTLKGIHERYKSMDKPLVLRLSVIVNSADPPQCRWVLVFDVLVDLVSIVCVQLDRLQFETHQEYLGLSDVQKREQKDIRFSGAKSLDEVKVQAGGSVGVGISQVVRIKKLQAAQGLKLREEKEAFFTLPSEAAEWALGVQDMSAANEKSKIKFLFMESEYVAVFYNKHIDELLACQDCDWCLGGGNYICLRVGNPKQDVAQPLSEAIKLGFGHKDRWLGKGGAASMGNLLADLVYWLARESNPLLMALNSPELDEKKTVHQQCRAKIDLLKQEADEFESFDANRFNAQGAYARAVDPEVEKLSKSVRESIDEAEALLGLVERNPGIFDELPTAAEMAAAAAAFGTGPPVMRKVATPPPKTNLSAAARASQLREGSSHKSDAERDSQESIDASQRERSPRRPNRFAGLNDPLAMANMFGQPLQPEVHAASDKKPGDATMSEAAPAPAPDAEAVPDVEMMPADDDDHAAVVPMEVDELPELPEEDDLLAQEEKKTAEEELQKERDLLKDRDPFGEVLRTGKGIPWDVLVKQIPKLKLNLTQWAEIFYAIYFRGSAVAENFALTNADFYNDEKGGKLKDVKTMLTAGNAYVKLLELANKELAATRRNPQQKTAKSFNMKSKKQAKNAPSTSAVVGSILGAGLGGGGGLTNNVPGMLAVHRPLAFDDVSEADDAETYAMRHVEEEPCDDRDHEERAAALEAEVARIEKEKKKLEAMHLAADGTESKALQKSKISFHLELDLLEEQAISKGKRLPLNCWKCGKKLADLEKNFIAVAGPQWKAHLVAPTKQKTLTRQLGPQSHCKIKCTTGARCFDGYWYGGKLYKDAGHTQLVEVDGLWECAKAFVAARVSELTEVCSCGPRKPSNIMSTLPQSLTFGLTKPPTNDNICPPVNENYPANPEELFM
eukprot:g9794.t1